MVGGLAMIALLTSGALLRGYGWWYPPNVLGSTFYGLRALRSGPGWSTLAGYALNIFTTGIVGILFGLTCGALERRRRLLLLGGVAGLIWYFFTTAVVWSSVNPLVPLYSLQPDTLMAHALFGMCLGRIGNVRAAEQLPPPLPLWATTVEAAGPLAGLLVEPTSRTGASGADQGVRPTALASAQTLEDKVE